ncbi:nephrosis 1, congenital, Finnish type (nephrin) [Cichlidogyrus casuarinus]|uniref:Nephrosis 1, congenital, Finnish type (Nephrin) n=1 Tax=Cichlidogyrus casuarinus TaxID=1844966 RepID=A0ABD2PZH4_9PLAT
MKGKIEEIEVKASKELNGKFISCVAKNSATSREGVESGRIRLMVEFMADSLQLKILSKGPVKKVAQCKTGSSNPNMNHLWWYYPSKLSDINKFHGFVPLEPGQTPESLAMEPPRQLERTVGPKNFIEVPERNQNESAGEYKGWTKTSEIDLDMHWMHVECEAWHNSFTRRLIDTIPVEVDFAPIMMTVKDSQIFTIRLDHSALLNPMPRAQPPLLSIRWYDPRNNPIHPWRDAFSPGIYSSGIMGQLLISELALSTLSFASAPPKIFGDPIVQVMVDSTKNSSIQLECSATGNPPISDETISYSRKPPHEILQQVLPDSVLFDLSCDKTNRLNEEIKHYVGCSKDMHEATKTNSHMVIYNVNKKDVGSYFCTVDNGITPVAVRRYNLYYHCEFDH